MKIIGFDLQSNSPVFLAVLAVHVPIGLAAVVTGAIAMLSEKHRGRHTRLGTTYYRCLAVLVGTSALLAGMRWSEDYYLFILGALAFAAAFVGRVARRLRWEMPVDLHIVGMGTSYIVMLTAFYVDNGKNLPLWRDLPPIAYWLLPSMFGVPLIVRALFRYRDVLRSPGRRSQSARAERALTPTVQRRV